MSDTNVLTNEKKPNLAKQAFDKLGYDTPMEFITDFGVPIGISLALGLVCASKYIL